MVSVSKCFILQCSALLFQSTLSSALKSPAIWSRNMILKAPFILKGNIVLQNLYDDCVLKRLVHVIDNLWEKKCKKSFKETSQLKIFGRFVQWWVNPISVLIFVGNIWSVKIHTVQHKWKTNTIPHNSYDIKKEDKPTLYMYL